MSNRIPLPQLAARLRPIMGDRTPNYHKLYFLGLAGLIDLKRVPERRGYYVEEHELPAIAEAVLQAGRSRTLAVAA